MYTPLNFKNENADELKQFIKHNNFGLLISEVNSRPWATHLPFVINTNTLSAHLSRGNRQWKQLSENKEVLVVFQGPHTYISSTWYDHENVPTYNYIAVHVYGQPRIVEGEELIAHLKQLVNHHEQHSSNPASVERMTPSYLQREIKGIVALEI
ncbi:MAG: FMN-binding negative transcriptional regulator, partial [Cyclobacteriaceae bacterium]